MSGSKTPILLIDISSEDESDKQSYSSLFTGEEPEEVCLLTPSLPVPQIFNSAEQKKPDQKPLFFSNLLLSSVNLVPVNTEAKLNNEEMTVTVKPLLPVESLINGTLKKSNDISLSSASNIHISPSFLSSSPSNSKSEQKNNKIVGSLLIDGVQPSAKRKSSWSITEPLEKKQKSIPKQTLSSEKPAHQTSKAFQAINGTAESEHVESSPDESTGSVANFVNTLRSTCARILNSVTNEYVNNIEESAEKCSVFFLASSKCKALIETSARQISSHLKSIEACVTQVIDELQSHSAPNYLQETNCTNDSISEPSSSSSLVKKVSFSCHPLPLAQSDPPNQEESAVDSAEYLDVGLRKKIKHYESLLKKLNRKIQFYRESEIASDEDEDSAYIRQDRLEKKALELSKILWKLNNEKFNTGRPIQKKISYHGTRYPKLNEAIQFLVNKTKNFPDFADVLDTVQTVDNDHNLGIGDTFNLAKTIFQEVFYEIKERRIRDHELHLDELLEENEQDPAEDNEEWLQRLKENNVQGQQRIQEIIDRFAVIPEKHGSGNSVSENEKSEGEDDDNKSDEEGNKSSTGNGDIFIEDECMYISDSDDGHDNEE